MSTTRTGNTSEQRQDGGEGAVNDRRWNAWGILNSRFITFFLSDMRRREDGTAVIPLMCWSQFETPTIPSQEPQNRAENWCNTDRKAQTVTAAWSPSLTLTYKSLPALQQINSGTYLPQLFCT